jgi:hypothetical protein
MRIPTVAGVSDIDGSFNVELVCLIFLFSLLLLLFCLPCCSNVLAVAHITAAVGISAIAGIITVTFIIFGVATFVFFYGWSPAVADITDFLVVPAAGAVATFLLISTFLLLQNFMLLPFLLLVTSLPYMFADTGGGCLSCCVFVFKNKQFINLSLSAEFRVYMEFRLIPRSVGTFVFYTENMK